MFSTTLPFVNPATGEKFGEITVSTPAEIAQAMADLRHNGRTWRQKSVAERVFALTKFKEFLIDSADEVAQVLNRDCGKTAQDGLTELFITVDNLNNMIHQAADWLARRPVPKGLYWFKEYYVEPVPYGVVAVIGPWNYPVVQVMTPVLAALTAGNVVIIKPSEVAPAVGALFAKLFASVPDIAPYVRVVHGGPEVGKAIVSYPPDLIFVTGSEKTGQAILKAAADHLTPVISELGGKDPLLVLDDADIQAAAKWSVWGAYYHSGQVCMSVERVYVLESVYDQFVQAVQEEVKQFKIGYTPDVNSPYNCGPITFERQLDIINSHLEDAKAQGAQVLAGGGRSGMFVEPTVLLNVNHQMKVMQDETFGPIMPIMKVKDEAEAIRLANDSPYGLCAYVWTQNLRRAERIAEQLEAGTVVVNDAMAHYAVSQLPFGGVKKSGSGRIHGAQEVLQFTQTKGVAIGSAPMPLDIATVFRQPGQYHNIKRVMKLVFGTSRQRVETVQETVAAIPPAGKVALAAGALALFGLSVFGLMGKKKAAA